MNLRKAAEMALECLNYHWDNPDSDLEHWPHVVEAKKALREALAKREWVGLTDEEKQRFKDLGLVGIDIIEAKLKQKNEPA